MKITTIKQYSNTYFVSFGYNGAQFGNSEEQITKDIIRTSENEAHDCFVEDTNKYRSIPTPQFDDCTFEIGKIDYTDMGNNYRLYHVKIRIIWNYIKE